MARTEKATTLPSAIPAIDVSKRIYTLRGRQVMLDLDLAQVYEVETKVLKQSVNRNTERFPADFMWRTTEDELTIIRSQIVTQNSENSFNGFITPNIRSQSVTEKQVFRSTGRRGSRYAPYVFTEHGVSMLSAVLNSPRAIRINIEIIRAFIQLRNEKREHLDLVPKLDSLENLFKQRFDRLEAQFHKQTTSAVCVPRPPAMHQPLSVIQNTVAGHFGLNSNDLKSPSRTQAISLPRQIAIYLARKYLSMSFSELGRHFGGRDHTTVLHAYRKILADFETNTMIRSTVDVLGREIQPMLA